MSCLPLDHEALALLRRLRPQEALQALQQAWMGLHFVNVACGQSASKFSCLTVNAMSSLILAQCHNVVAFKGWTRSTCKHSYLLLFALWPLDLLWKVGLARAQTFFVVLPRVQVSIQGINNNMSSYIKIKAQGGCGTASMEPDMALHFALSWKVRSKLGDPDNTDEAARFEGMKVWKHCWSVKCSAGPCCDCKDPKMPQPVPPKTDAPKPNVPKPDTKLESKQWSQPSGLRRKMQWWRTEFCIAGDWMNLTLQMCLWQGAITNQLTRLASPHTNYNLEFRITSNFHLFCMGKVHVFHPHPLPHFRVTIIMILLPLIILIILMVIINNNR